MSFHQSSPRIPRTSTSRANELVSLVAAAGAGDADAFAALVARFEPLVHKVALDVTRHPEDAAEVVQQTWLVLFYKIKSIRIAEALPGWLRTTARREAFRLLRERS